MTNMELIATLRLAGIIETIESMGKCNFKINDTTISILKTSRDTVSQPILDRIYKLIQKA